MGRNVITPWTCHQVWMNPLRLAIFGGAAAICDVIINTTFLKNHKNNNNNKQLTTYTYTRSRSQNSFSLLYFSYFSVSLFRQSR